VSPPREGWSSLAPFLPNRNGGIFSPRTVDELTSLVRALRDQRVPIEMRGSGAGRPWARQDPAPDHSIRMAAIAGEPEIAPLDLVMSVDAGVSLHRAKTAAREKGLDLALENPPFEPCTVGGLLARGEGRGAQLAPAGARAVVLGMDVVLPEGRLVRCGGRVVKNVAGYDSHRLFVGSLGTLGAIARVHLKLVPLSGIEESWIDLSPLATALDRAEWILQQVPQIGSLAIECMLDPSMRDDKIGTRLLDSPARLRVRIRGSRRRVEILRDRLSSALPGPREDEEGDLLPEPAERDFGMVASVRPANGESAGPAEHSSDGMKPAALVRGTVPRTDLGALLVQWDGVLRDESVAGKFWIHPAGAEVWLMSSAPLGPTTRAALARACRPRGRFLEAWRPTGVAIPSWDPIPAMLPFWIALRNRLDPDNLWNPGIVPVAGGR
jgi:FAD/FMN-containing dehydrogenase